MENFTPWSALAGGLLIGLAAASLLFLNGRIAGFSGIIRGATQCVSPDRAWRFAFLAGCILGGALWWLGHGPNFVPRSGFPVPLLVFAGVLVGFGTNLGNGCTSGHGVCGLGRASGRSLAATLTFFSIALVTTFVVRHVLGGAA